MGVLQVCSVAITVKLKIYIIYDQIAITASNIGFKY